jgi:lipoprotein-anchoring transpeptidase ErfK/SrfK
VRRLPLSLCLLIGGLAGGVPAAAVAQAPPAPVVVTPAPAAPAPVAPTVRVTVQNEGRLPIAAVIAGGRVRVVGTVRPYIGGQTVFVRTSRADTKLETRQVPVVNIGNGVGYFAAVLGVGGRPGTVRVVVSHDATTLEPEFVSSTHHIAAVRATVSFGDRGPSVRLLQQELDAMHYAVPRSGVFDDGTGRAVIAFRKLSNLTRTAQANRVVFERLGAGLGTFKVRFPHQGAHFEGDLTHQVLAEVMAGGRVRRIYEMSSGKPSTPTVIGNFSIYSKTLGTNAKGMVDANYFIRGYAIHGYFDVPVYPASHGCLRIPIPDAAAVYSWAQYGFPVDVYYRNGGGSHTVRGNAGP